MSELVTALCAGNHPVEIALRPSPSVSGLKECIERGFVHIRFPETRGGTELGVPLDRSRSNISLDVLTAENGRLQLVGDLSLDYVRVRCIADLELPSLAGRGRLELLEAANPQS